VDLLPNEREREVKNIRELFNVIFWKLYKDILEVKQIHQRKNYKNLSAWKRLKKK